MKTIVFVVHGIGEQSAGQTLDQLVGGVVGNRSARIETDSRWLSEEVNRESQRNVGLFPCHIQRVKLGRSDIVFSEVYWADLSRGRKGFILNAIDLITGIFSLSHVARANVSEIYPDNHPLRWLAWLIICMMIGPMAALAVLTTVVGIVVPYATYLALGRPDLSETSTYEKALFGIHGDIFILVAGFVSVVIGMIIRQTRKGVGDYLPRMFGAWLSGSGLALIVFAFFVGFKDFLPWSMWVRSIVPYLIDWINVFGIYNDITPVFLSEFIFAVSLGWVFAITSFMLFIILTWQGIFGKNVPHSNASPIYTAILALIYLFISFIISIIWGFSQEVLPEGVISPFLHSSGSLQFVYLVSFIIIMISIAASFNSRRKYIRNIDRNNYDSKIIPRIIVNNNIKNAIFISLITSIVLSNIISFIIGADIRMPTYLREVFSFSLVITLIVSYAYSYFWQNMSTALAIGKDIITYFRAEPATDHKWTFPLRDRIQRRFVVVVDAMIETEEPECVIFVSHSQGTIIATKAIEIMINDSFKNSKCGIFRRKVKYTKFITMGSPYEHIYGYYFPSEFMSKNIEKLNEGIQKWVNIFRTDDFVGTKIVSAEANWPENMPVDANGHTGYWTDKQVLGILIKEITNSNASRRS